jgi:hypothetical protein
MSKVKRRSLADHIDAPQPEAQHLAAVTPSRRHVITLQSEPPIHEAPQPKRRSPGDRVRNGYHASLYLPDEAQFALREIALMLRKPKPHDVMLEAMADLFERYNKGDLAAECRRRASRDSVTT